MTLLLSALAVPMSGTASAATCVAVAEPPHLVPGEGGIHASGTFHCADGAFTGMTVTVCIEERFILGSDDPTWYSHGCETTVAEGAAQTVVGRVTVDMMVYSTYLRTTVTAINDNGDAGQTESPPVFWFNCACYIG